MASENEQSPVIEPVSAARAPEQQPGVRRGEQGLPVWVAWVLVCAGAGVVARTTGQFMSLMVLGLAFGAAQALVVRRQPPQSSVDLQVLWVVASAVGGVVGFVLGGTAASLLDERPGLLGNHLGTVGFGVVLWTVIGGAQGLVLRQSAPRAGRWVLASAVGGVAWAAAEIAISIGSGGSAAGDAAGYGLVTGACYGSVTGLALAQLFPALRVARQPWLAAIPIVMAGMLVVRVMATRDVCDAEEQAALAEFPQYGGVQLTPRTDEAGGCAVSYATSDTVEQVTAYFRDQLTAHSWTIEPQQNRSEYGGELTARRGGVRYAVFYASNAYNTPPQPGVRLDIQVRKP